MSRPKLVSAAGVNVKIQVPGDWFTTISIVRYPILPLYALTAL